MILYPCLVVENPDLWTRTDKILIIDSILISIYGCGNITSLYQRPIKQDIEIRKVLILFHIKITSWKFCFTQFWKSCQLGDVPHCPYTAYTDFGCLPIGNFFSDVGLQRFTVKKIPCLCQPPEKPTRY